VTDQLYLYGTDGCHLCHDAQQLLLALNLGWDDVDIVEDDALLQRYGTRIPVLKRAGSEAELDWPFDLQQISTFLRR
jgi:glutaredoxin